MSTDLYVRSLSGGRLVVRRRAHVSGELLVSFSDPNVEPIHITDSNPVVVTDHKGATAYTIQRSNLRTLLSQNYLEVLSP